MPSLIYDHTKGLFQQSGTGIAMAPQVYGETVTDTATQAAITATAGIEIIDYTAVSACTVTLPAATVGARYMYVQAKSPAHGGGADLVFDCAGTDAFETGSTVESRNSDEVTFDVSTAGETKLTIALTNANNFFDTGSRVLFVCSSVGKWHVEIQPRPLGTGIKGTATFSS